MKQIDQIKLLMEETGCDESQARLALDLSDANFEKALSTISFLLKVIKVFKIKLIFIEENIYGLVQVAINIKNSKVLRCSTAFSQNPAVYEISERTDWFSFEKAIFSTRIEPGSLEKYTQTIEHTLKQYLQQVLKELVFVSKDEILDIMKAFFSPTKIDINILEEELNLTQFKKFPGKNSNNTNISLTGYDIGFVKLDAQVIEDPNGKPVKKIKEGAIVFSRITDTRDISHYLIHLIGGRDHGIMSPIPAKIQKICCKNGIYEIHLNYAPSVTGLATVKKNSKLKMPEWEQSWWEKFLPW